MTEEIIIDDVNVAGCEKLGETIDGITCGLGKRIRFANEIITKHNLCEDNPYCYYKQLKRLEQENKELKEKKDKYYQQTLDNEILMNELSLEVDLRKKESDFYLEKLSKYRSALEEIREIVTSAFAKQRPYKEDFAEIETKINECIGG